MFVAPGPPSEELVEQSSQVERTHWRREVLAKHPQIKELQESLYPLHRAASFAELYQPAGRESKDQIGRETLLRLIFQHLDYFGYTHSATKLEQEALLSHRPLEWNTDSRLDHFLRKGLAACEKVYDNALAERLPTESDLEDTLAHLGLLEEEEEEEEEDINIWAEPDNENIIKEEKEKGNVTIKAASLNKLVEKLTSEESPDLMFVKTFLMTYQSFTSPQKLLTKLFQRYDVPGQSAEENSTKTAIIQLRVINVLKKWLEENYSDFDEKMITSLREFITETCQHTNPAHSDSLLKSLKKARDPPIKQFDHPPPEPVVLFKNIFSRNLTFNDMDELELARQMTLIEFDIFQQIKPSELLKCAWSKAKLKSRAPHVLQLSDRFNRVSLWVAHIILSCRTIKMRVKVMTKFINIAQHLKAFNNFNSVMEVMAGFNSAAVHRLKHTRAALSERSKELLEELEKTLSADGAYKNYRDSLSRVDPPCLPYLGVFLTDLTFIEENPDKAQGLINFAKRRLIYTVISKIQTYQQMSYNLQPVHQIRQFLLNLPNVDEQELYRLSLLREPRNADRTSIA
ncbi:Guanine-nucleotide dissociation stimulator CDC25 [Balamuthia mandrillaris]